MKPSSGACCQLHLDEELLVTVFIHFPSLSSNSNEFAVILSVVTDANYKQRCLFVAKDPAAAI